MFNSKEGTYEDAALQVKRSAVLQHCCSFARLLNSAGSFTPAVRGKEGWEFVCSNAHMMRQGIQTAEQSRLLLNSGDLQANSGINTSHLLAGGYPVEQY